jgi:hypothetical protein
MYKAKKIKTMTTIIKSNKQTIADAANLELKRIGASTNGGDSFDVGLDCDGRIAAGDNSGYYVCKNYKTLVSDLKEFADNSITDPLYDGEDAWVWSEIWSLFDA